MAATKPWAEMTWQERREERCKHWLSATGVKFVSAGAEKLYKERATRFIKAIKLEEPDRVRAMMEAACEFGTYRKSASATASAGKRE